MIDLEPKKQNTDIRIQVVSLSKKFRLKRGPRVLINAFSGKDDSSNVLEAVKNVDLTVRSGEVVGLIGLNGSGKSTLLRVIGGLLQADGGVVSVFGKTMYLSGFSFSTDPYMTVRQNIYFIGAILGLRHFEVEQKFSEIVEFSGLGDFLEMEAFKLSSGMQIRLNTAAVFLCMEYIKPDILLLDEVLSVGGDVDFQRKSINKIEQLVKGGATVILAAHDLTLVQQFCGKVILLDHGRIIKEGLPGIVIDEYIKTNR